MRYKDLISESQFGEIIPWPKFIDMLSSALRAMGWRGKRQEDEEYLFSVNIPSGDWLMLIIENTGNGFFTYNIGLTGSITQKAAVDQQPGLPLSAASLSELTNLVAERVENENDKSEAAEQKFLDLVVDFYEEGNSDELLKMEWKPEYGDDYAVVVLYGFGRNSGKHMQFTKDDLGLSDENDNDDD